MDPKVDVFEIHKVRIAPASINCLRRLRELHVDFRGAGTILFSMFGMQIEVDYFFMVRNRYVNEVLMDDYAQ
jgi:hypothetical protein